jgi:CTP synthase (UTP-ammonia lyase)
MTAVRVGLIGDHDPSVTAHRAIPLALQLAAARHGTEVACEWIATDHLGDGITPALAGCDGIWCVPASPYRREAGALRGIRFARESRRPFLGTCGGFQHAVLEYARNVLGMVAAAHAETDPGARETVIAPLSCGLVEASGSVVFTPRSRLAAIYAAESAVETYHCSYGLNPAFEGRLSAGPLRVVARDTAGEVRAMELLDHPFFVLTLYQPERAALTGKAHPLINAFVAAAGMGRGAGA